MAQINEAWRVLSDPGRRAIYDAQTRNTGAATTSATSASAGGGTATATRPAARPAVAPNRPVAVPARFPWRFMLICAAAGIAFILANAALTKPGPADVPDNLMNPGSCVNFASNGDAVEVPCNGTNSGVVDSLIALDGLCPQDTEGHRDHQGMGQVCVRLTTVRR